MSPIEFQRKRINDEAAAAISDAARLANEIQAAGVGVKRSEALLEAERIQAKFGLGWSLASDGNADSDAESKRRGGAW